MKRVFCKYNCIVVFICLLSYMCMYMFKVYFHAVTVLYFYFVLLCYDYDAMVDLESEY
jgi:hypothetical protein